MPRVTVRMLAAAGFLVPAALVGPAVPAGFAAASSSPAATPPVASSSLCPPATPTSHPHGVHRLRIGVDPGKAANPIPSTEAPKPVNHHAQLKALEQLRPPHRVLVVRLNRLFWSGGQQALEKFRKRAHHYARHGFEVEAQVRYQPTPAENGDISAWKQWIRHVTKVLGRNHSLVAMTITNEVNLGVSSNTSDGSYERANAALVKGIEAASHELHKHGWAHRVSLGFTFAYRFDPSTDAGLFQYLASHGGAKFRKALGFVGLDDYPGTFYPPVLLPGDTAGDELASAIATMRTCYLPLADIPGSTPIWVTENGYPSGSPLRGDELQADALRSMVHAVRRYAGSYNVTDYRWFNLRDNASNGTGMFDQVGLLRDDYSRKPAYSDLRTFIRHHGEREHHGRASR